MAQPLMRFISANHRVVSPFFLLLHLLRLLSRYHCVYTPARNSRVYVYISPYIPGTLPVSLLSSLPTGI